MQMESRSEIGRRLLDLWSSRLRGREMPAREDFDPLDMGPLLANTLLVNVNHEPLDFNYRLIGTGIVARSVRDYTGERLADLPAQRRPSRIWSLFEKAVVERRPVLAMVPQLNIPDLSVEMQALPLSEDGGIVNMLIGTVVFGDNINRPGAETAL